MTWEAFRAALLQWPPLFWQFDKFAAGNAFPISGMMWHSVPECWVCCGGWVVGWLEFGTGEGLLGYRICVPCSKRLPPVRDASSEAFGVKNRLLRCRRDIRYRKPPPTVRNEATGCGHCVDSSDLRICHCVAGSGLRMRLL